MDRINLLAISPAIPQMSAHPSVRPPNHICARQPDRTNFRPPEGPSDHPIALDLHIVATAERQVWDHVEDMFLLVFAGELMLKLIVFRFGGFFDFSSSDFWWNAFDFLIVSLGGSPSSLPDASRSGCSVCFRVLRGVVSAVLVWLFSKPEHTPCRTRAAQSLGTHPDDAQVGPNPVRNRPSLAEFGRSAAAAGPTRATCAPRLGADFPKLSQVGPEPTKSELTSNDLGPNSGLHSTNLCAPKRSSSPASTRLVPHAPSTKKLARDRPNLRPTSTRSGPQCAAKRRFSLNVDRAATCNDGGRERKHTCWRGSRRW